jgi:TolB-like protein/Tfp pilus assembly protein PilF
MESFLTDLEALQSALLTGTGAGRVAPTTAAHARWRKMIAAAAALFLALAGGVAGWRVWDGQGKTLSRQPTPAPRSGPLSIAVLPMENLSNDPNQDYLADGMTEALITDLAKTGNFRVISRTSVMQYKRSGKSLRDIARELNVDRIVEGSVIKAGDEIRITAQLIDTATDEHLWAESYQRNLTDVLSLQEDVAQAIASEVKTQLGGSKGRLRPAYPVNPQAYEAFLRARQLAFQWSPESIERGIGYYKKAIEIDPGYANAHAGLAAAYGLKVLFGMASPSETWPLARAAAERALELDDETESAHTSLGFVQASYDWNWYGAEREFLRAIELNPGSVTAHHAYAMVCLAPQGRLDEALAEIEQARNLDPLSAAVNLNVGDVYYFRREFEKATRQLRKTLELDPNFPNVRRWLGNVAFSMGNRTAAAEYFRQAVGAQGDRNPVALVAYLITTGREEEARERLKQLGQDAVASRLLTADLAALYTMLGDKEAAFEWLERAYLERSGSLTFAKVSPIFEPLHSDPRFQSLLRRLNLER